MLKKIIKNLIYYLTPKFCIKNYIIFESNPDYTDNAKIIFDKFISEGLNNKYKLLWFVSNAEEFNDIRIPNVKFIDILPKSIIGKMKTFYYQNSAKLILDGNKYVRKLNKHQLRIHLMHGVGFKNALSYQRISGKIDYLISTTDFFNESFSNGYMLDKNNIISLGYPRNDILYNKTEKDVKNILNIPSDSKLILWMPTYRQNKNLNEKTLKINKLGIPVFNNIKELEKLNKYLKENNIYIYLKPHPVQDLTVITKKTFSNFSIITDKNLKDHDITLYELLSKTDSIITDYSSIYFDYLLTKNIIGVTLDDIDEINKSNKLIIDNYESIIGGFHIYNYDDFIKYLEEVKHNKKMDIKELKKYNKYIDGNSTDRLYEFIINKLED